MARNSFLSTQMDNCTPGFLTRYPYGTTIESWKQGEQVYFGQAVILKNGVAMQAKGNIVSADIYGFAHYPYPQTLQAGTNPAAPQIDKPVGIMRTGYIAVKQAIGDTTTALIGIPVFTVTTASTDGTYAVGDVCSSATIATGGVAIAVPNAYFMSNSDTRKYTEISFRV